MSRVITSVPQCRIDWKEMDRKEKQSKTNKDRHHEAVGSKKRKDHVAAAEGEEDKVLVFRNCFIPLRAFLFI